MSASTYTQYYYEEAYCQGLTGKAAEWVVQKQKQYQSASERVMKICLVYKNDWPQAHRGTQRFFQSPKKIGKPNLSWEKSGKIVFRLSMIPALVKSN